MNPILSALDQGALYTHEIMDRTGENEGETLIALVNLWSEGRVMRKKNGAWCFTIAELNRVRHRRHMKEVRKDSPGNVPNATKDNSPFPPPPYPTPNVGFFY